MYLPHAKSFTSFTFFHIKVNNKYMTSQVIITSLQCWQCSWWVYKVHGNNPYISVLM